VSIKRNFLPDADQLFSPHPLHIALKLVRDRPTNFLLVHHNVRRLSEVQLS